MLKYWKKVPSLCFKISSHDKNSKQLIFKFSQKFSESKSKDLEVSKKSKEISTSKKKHSEEETEFDFNNLSFKDLTFFKKKKSTEVKPQEESITTIKFDENSDFKANTEVELQLKDNPLALKVLKEGSIDLKDKRIRVDALKMTDAAMIDSSLVYSTKQINLGNVNVLPKNSVLLEDIDVYNLPDDKDIMIDKQEKIMVAIGRKMHRKGELKVVQSSEEEMDSRSVHKISKKIFEEKTFDEFKRENLFGIEYSMVKFNYKELARAFIAIIPLMVFFAFFCETAIELYLVKRDDYLIEKQIMGNLMAIREKYARDTLMNNPVFDRQRILKAAAEPDDVDII